MPFSGGIAAATAPGYIHGPHTQGGICYFLNHSCSQGCRNSARRRFATLRCYTRLRRPRNRFRRRISKMFAQADNATLQYLKDSVEEQLSNALAEVICRRPDDPIEFIGNYLLDAARASGK